MPINSITVSPTLLSLRAIPKMGRIRPTHVCHVNDTGKLGETAQDRGRSLEIASSLFLLRVVLWSKHPTFFQTLNRYTRAFIYGLSICLREIASLTISYSWSRELESIPRRGVGGPCSAWPREQAGHKEAAAKKNDIWLNGEFLPHQQWEHGRLSIIFLTPDKRQASDVRENTVPKTLNLETPSHIKSQLCLL